MTETIGRCSGRRAFCSARRCLSASAWRQLGRNAGPDDKHCACGGGRGPEGSRCHLAHNVHADAPAFHRALADRPAAGGRRRAARRRCASSSRRSSGWAISPTARPTATGPSTARCPGPSCGCASATPSRCSLKNHEDSWMQHNVDFHAVTGPGGGGVATVADPGAEQGLHLQGAQPRPLRLSLRRADGRPAHRQRHVRADPGRAGRRPAAGRPRVLRDAGRDLHRGGVRHEGRAHRELRQAA